MNTVLVVLLVNLVLGMLGVLLHAEEFPSTTTRRRHLLTIAVCLVLGVFVYGIAEFIRLLDRAGFLLVDEESFES
jgi:F0F1-type ATP synthase membrane subunit a